MQVKTARNVRNMGGITDVSPVFSGLNTSTRVVEDLHVTFLRTGASLTERDCSHGKTEGHKPSTKLELAGAWKPPFRSFARRCRTEWPYSFAHPQNGQTG